MDFWLNLDLFIILAYAACAIGAYRKYQDGEFSKGFFITILGLILVSVIQNAASIIRRLAGGE